MHAKEVDNEFDSGTVGNWKQIEHDHISLSAANIFS